MGCAHAHAKPRRIEIDTDGTVWFAEYTAGKIGSFDPRTQTFKEYALPGPEPTPYALGIDKNHILWYSSDEMDIIGRLDPKTGHVTEFPYAHSENDMKEFFLDAQGRMWYGSGPNNKVGYFIPASGELKILDIGSRGSKSWAAISSRTRNAGPILSDST